MARGWTYRWLALGLYWAMPATAGTHVEPSVKATLEGRFDDELFLRAQTGPTGQMMTKLSPEVGLGLKNETLDAAAKYAVDLMLRTGTGSASVDHRGGLEFKKAFSLRTLVDGNLSLWRVSDPISLPRLGMGRILSPVVYGKGELGAAFRVTPRLSWRLGYRFEGARVETFQQPAGVVHAPYTESWLRATRRTSLGIEYRYQYFSFGTEAAQSNGVFAGYKYRLSPFTTFTVKGGPLLFIRQGNGPSGWMPRASAELSREGETVDLAMVVGHDLMGASGFTSALWATFASGMASVRVGDFRLFGAASYFRNGQAPWGPPVQGYSGGAGVEWELSEWVALQGSFDHFSQVASPLDVGRDLSRNIGALKLVLTGT